MAVTRAKINGALAIVEEGGVVDETSDMAELAEAEGGLTCQTAILSASKPAG